MKPFFEIFEINGLYGYREQDNNKMCAFGYLTKIATQTAIKDRYNTNTLKKGQHFQYITIKPSKKGIFETIKSWF